MQAEEQQRNNSKMSSQETVSIWIQLYVGETESGGVVLIHPIPENVYYLTEEIKAKKAAALLHCDADELNVFAVGTQVLTAVDKVPLRPGMKLSELDATTDEKPLIVVAPLPPPQQPQQQEGRMRCCALYSCVLSSSCETIQKSHNINCWDDRCLMTCVWTDLCYFSLICA